MNNNKSKTGFTLVELLVVISIIAALLSVLLPALNSAREQAKTVYCATNLRTLHQAVTLYSMDYDGRFPVFGLARVENFYGSGEDLRIWRDYLVPYIGGGNKEDYLISTRKDFKIFRCPSDRHSKELAKDNDAYGFLAYSYVANNHCSPFYAIHPTNPKPEFAYPKFIDVKTPSRRMLYADYEFRWKSGGGAGLHAINGWGVYPGGTQNLDDSYRHRNGFNMVMVPGNVEYRRYPERIWPGLLHRNWDKPQYNIPLPPWYSNR